MAFYSAFQWNSYQNNAFQIARNGGASPIAPDTHDAGAYEGYRKRLKRMIEISNERDRKKYISIVQEQIVPVENALVEQSIAIVSQEIARAEPDYDLIARQSQIALARVEAVLAYYERMAKRRRNREAIIMLLSTL